MPAAGRRSSREIARMRTSWLIAVAVGLAGAGALRAEVVVGNQTPPGAKVSPAGPAVYAPPSPGGAWAHPPALTPAVPPANGGPGCAPAGCNSGKKCGPSCDGRSFGERLKAWLCYQPVKGCCDKKACGCKPAPLYAYFADDCVQGKGCAQAPACCEKPGLWRRLCESGHKVFGSPAGHGCGAGHGCTGGACGVR
jgi:hypothetical protein